MNSLAALLSVDRSGEGVFTAQLRDWGDGASFGGDALARAVLAAALDCGGKQLHALHASFLRPLPAAVPLRIRVEALSGGRRLARRHVRIERDERLLCAVTASFSAPGDGVAWQESAPPADVPAPETLRSDVELAREEKWDDWDLEHEEVEWRWVGRPWDPRQRRRDLGVDRLGAATRSAAGRRASARSSARISLGLRFALVRFASCRRGVPLRGFCERRARALRAPRAALERVVAAHQRRRCGQRRAQFLAPRDLHARRCAPCVDLAARPRRDAARGRHFVS